MMKKRVFSIMAFASAILFFSCSNDDNGGGVGGEPNNPHVYATVYSTSNTSNKIGVFDFMAENRVVKKTFNVGSANNQGIFYNKESDELVVGSKDQKVLNVYSNVEDSQEGASLDLLLSSDSVMQNPRDIAVKDEIYIVSDNTDLDSDPNTEEGRFFVFKKDDNGFTLRNTITVDYAVWGIQLINNDLYSTVDNTGDVAVFKNFISTYTTDATAAPDKRVTIERINRIHGISEDTGVVVLTDIGEEDNDIDGAFHTINDFVSRFNATPNGGQLDFSGNQVRIEGLFTELGNPVAIDYDNSRRIVFVAERTNDGGKVLFFSDVEAGGELRPTLSIPFEGASSLYFIDR